MTIGALLAQLRTGKSRLNDYLAKINAVESDQCGYGTGRETVQHFFSIAHSGRIIARI